MLGVRPGWTALSVDGQAVQTKDRLSHQIVGGLVKRLFGWLWGFGKDL